ncbi:MAG TPA: hypothetical protein DCS93_03220 [Microscillaceae bacterium]|nr:hypothetical protein [Microscillaceae bacterium]
MNTSTHSVYNFQAQDKIPQLSFWGAVLATIVVLSTLAGIFFQAAEFALIFEDYLSIEEILALAIGFTLIGAGWLGRYFWKDHKKAKRLQYVYNLSLEPAAQRVHLTKHKKKGYVNFAKTYALFTEEGLFVSIGFWSPASGQLHGTITNEDDRWDRDDILEMVSLLEQAGMQVKRQVKEVGKTVGNKVVFKSKLINENTIWATIILVGMAVATIMYDKLLENAYFILILGFLIYGVFMYNQKRFVVTPKYLIVQNRWIPFYRQKISINHIYKIAFEELDNDQHTKRLVVKTKVYREQQVRKFYSKVTAKNQQQVAFLITEQIKRTV